MAGRLRRPQRSCCAVARLPARPHSPARRIGTWTFNTEGLVHIGLLPELIEDARRDAVAEADLEPLFRSAEGYIRMWERAEQRSGALGGG